MDFYQPISRSSKAHRGFVLFFAVFALVFFGQAQSVFAATYTVTVATDTDDSTCDADCSLREAIDDANANVGTDTIDFDAGLSGGTVTLASVLPSLTEATIIDGTALADQITITGVAFGDSIIKFDNTDSGNVIKGVTLLGSEGTTSCINALGTTGLIIGGSVAGNGNIIGACISGILLTSDSDTSILGNSIGSVVANNDGISSTASTNLVIGGIDADEKNIVVSNAASGMYLVSVTTATILGNNIGVDATGAVDLGNSGWGVYITGVSSGVTVGGTTAPERNLISGNQGGGVIIASNTVTSTVIKGNYIGTAADGTSALGNSYHGIHSLSAITIGGTAAGSGNVITANLDTNVYLGDAGGDLETANVTGSTVQGNYVGVDKNGAALPGGNNSHGIWLKNSNNTIGGTVAGAKNVISGNVWWGILIQGDVAISENNLIQGNYIGTNVAGSAAVSNDGGGIGIGTDVTTTTIGGSIAAGAGNLISGNTGVAARGIFVDSIAGDGHIIQGNIIGLDITKTVDLGNTLSGVEIQTDNNTVGGETADSRNWTSGNDDYGIVFVSSSGNTVKNNYSGTGATGTEALGNDIDGIAFIDTCSNNIIGAVGEGNITVDNGEFGIYISSSLSEDNTIQGNYVGVDATGDGDLGNVNVGVASNGINTQIGGVLAGEGNVISGNGAAGVSIGATGTTVIEGNKIGTNADGDTVITNIGNGVNLFTNGNTVGGTVAGARNIISGNTGHGVYLENSADNTVEGNYIGVDVTGELDFGNALAGVDIAGAGSTGNIVGGTVAGAKNIISGNVGEGVVIETGAGDNNIAGNYIGTDVDGLQEIHNNVGVRVYASNNTIGGTVAGARNIISGNTVYGVFLGNVATGVTVENNYIGTDMTGLVALPNGSHGIYLVESAANNFIGVAGYGNVISGNGAIGIYTDTDANDSNSIQANYIGVDATGLAALGNTNAGIQIVWADFTQIGTINTPSARNVIAGNGDVGIRIYLSMSDTVVNNYIGVGSDGTTIIPNTYHDISIENTSANNIIGGIATGAGNIMAAATGYSCTTTAVDAGHYNIIRGNSCMNESATELNISRVGNSNEAAATPVISAATTSRVNGTTIFSTGSIDIFVDGVYTASTTAVGGVWSKDIAISGTNVSASVTTTTNSTSSTTAFTAVVADASNPTVSTLSPADGATGVSTTANLVLTFNESVDVESGNILIKKTVGGTTVDTIAVTDGAVTGSGTNTITINPTVTLAALTGYYVQIAATGFDDLSGNSYAGIADTTSWNFTTAGTVGVTASAISGATTEAGVTATFTVVLETQPTNDVTVPITSSDTTEGTISPASLTFTSSNWNTPQTVTLAGVNDDVDDGDGVYSAVLGATTSVDSNYNGLNPDDVSATNTDDDTFGISVSAISGDTTEAGGTGTFTVVLDSEPVADVTIPVSSSDTTEGTVSTSSLTFTNANWSTPQIVTVTGVDDSIDDGDANYYVVMSSITSADPNYDSVNPDDVSVTNTDDDDTVESGITDQAPVFTGSLINVSFIAGSTTESLFDLDDYFSDSDSDPLVYTASGNRNVTVIINDDGTVTLTAVSDFNGVESIVFTATDPDGLIAVSNPVSVSVSTEDARSIFNYVTGTSRGLGTIRTFDQNNMLLADWAAFAKGGVIPRLSAINGTQYIFAVKKHGGTTMHVYTTSGELLATKRLSPHIHQRRLAIGNLDDSKTTKEIVVAAQRGSTSYIKVFRFHADTNSFVLIKRHHVNNVTKSYRVEIKNKQVLLIANGTGKTLYSWKVF